MQNEKRNAAKAARIGVAIAVATTLPLVQVIPSSARRSDAGEARFIQGQIVVGYERGSERWVRMQVREAVGASGVREMPYLDVLDLPGGVTVPEALNRVPELPGVVYAEPNYVIQAATQPNDPLYEDAWSIGPTNSSGIRSGIDTPSAWNLTVGSADVAIGVVDSGVDLQHPDLASNIWVNPGEAGAAQANGKDDDGNGYVDDWRGWDWIDEDNDPSDVAGHGTNVAGTIGAQGNNGVGGSGVTWKSPLMALRVLDSGGLGLTSDAASAFSYAADAGAKVVNASLTATVPSAAMLQAISTSPNTLFVAAAGNETSNNDVSARFPCNLQLPNVLCVAATDEHNKLASFSNHGAVSVDLAAPGTAIVTTHLDGYVDFYGTSAATPHVAGAAALLWAQHPNESPASISGAIVNGVEPLPSLQGKVSSGGRLNAAAALRQLGSDVPDDRGSPGFEKRFSSSDQGDDRDKKKKKKKWCRRHKRHGHRHARCRRR